MKNQGESKRGYWTWCTKKKKKKKKKPGKTKIGDAIEKLLDRGNNGGAMEQEREINV